MKQYQTSIYEGLAPFGTCLFHREIKPEEENFLEMLKFTFVPYLQLYTFTFFWLLTVSFVFIYSLYWDETAGFKENSPAEFLKVSQNALFQLGQNYPHFVVKQFHLYRMFTSTVLFRNLYHFLVSCSGIAMFGSYVEEVVGFKRVFLLSVTSGVGGELVRNVFLGRASIESITPICGVMGFMLGLFLANCDSKWKYYSKEKMYMLMIMLFALILYAQLAIAYRNISLLSMVMGLLIGFLIYYCDPEPKSAHLKIPAIVLLGALIGLSAFYFLFRSSPPLIAV